MSYIDNALKKAQREKDGRYAAYGGIVSPEGGEIPDRSGGRVWKYTAVVSVAVMVAAGVVALRMYPDLGEQRGQPVKSSYRKPAPAPVLSRQSIPLQPMKSVQEGNKTVLPEQKGISSIDKKKTETAELFKKALWSQKQGHFNKAEGLYRRILQISPGNAQALNNLGVICLGRKDEDQAIRFFNRAIIARGSKADPYYNLACVFARRGDTMRSLQYLRRAVAVDSGVKGWAREDGDLKNLKPVEEFRKLVGINADENSELQTETSVESPLASPAGESHSLVNMDKK
ncbi:MAG: tetratricopeptide repeat protein [Syntrophales bacterium]|jgi:tetratricopeptide (TPR) repeat protein